MIITTIKLKQFMSYADEAVWHPQLDVTGIIGEYEDDSLRSNGSGKSTLVMSIIYALYGEGRFGTIDEVVYDKANPVDMFVEIEFLLNNNKYSILRGRKKSSPYLVVTENGQILGNEQTTIAQKQELINSVMGMDYDMFTATVFFEQGNAAKFINSGSSKSTEYLDKCLNLTAFRELIKTTNSEITKKRDILTDTTNQLSNIQSTVSSISADIVALDTSSIDIPVIESEISLLQKTQSSLTADLERYNNSEELLSKLAAKKSELDTAKSRQGSASSAMADNVTEISSARSSIESIEKEISNIKDRTTYEDISPLLNDIQKNKDTMETTLALLGGVQQDVSAVSEKINNEEKNKIRLMSDIDGLSRTLDKITTGKCSHCFQDISPEYIESHKSGVMSELNKIREQVNTVTAIITSLTAEKQLLLTKEAGISSEIKSLSIEATRLNQAVEDSKRKKLEVDLILKTHESTIASLKSTIEKNTQANTLLQTQIADLEVIITNLSMEVNSLSYEIALLSDDGKDKVLKELGAVSNLIDSKKSIVSDTLIKRGQVKAKEQELASQFDRLKTLEASIDTLKTEIKVFTIMVDIYKSMIESVFNDSVRLIEYYANLFLQKVYPNYSVRVYRDTKSKREPLIYEFICDGSKRNYSMLSGGQKTVADISLRLGFSKTLSDRAQTKIDFVCLDEPFESLDEPNREVIKSILVSLRDTFKQIFIISHTPDARDCTHTVKVFMNKNSQSSLKTA